MLKVCTAYFEYCNLFIRKDYFFSIKSLVGLLQFMVGQKHNLVRHLSLPQNFPVEQNVWCAFHLFGQFFNLAGDCPMSNCYLRPVNQY